MLTENELHLIMHGLIMTVDHKAFEEYIEGRAGENCIVTVRLPEGSSKFLSDISEKICGSCDKADRCSQEKKGRIGSEFISTILYSGLYGTMKMAVKSLEKQL